MNVEPVNVERYAFQEAERLRLGRFPVLDTILYRWARRIEESLFERFQMEIYAGASVVEEMKFSSFYGSLKSAKPIYFFELEPLEGQGLLVLDNRFANLCINPPSPRGSAVGAVDRVLLAPHNQGRLQQVVQRLMADFEQCWQDVYPVQAHLRKITTYLFRARILSSYERCLVAQIHLSGEQVSARLTWCFPRIMLEPILNELQSSRVIPSMVPERRPVPRFAERGSLEDTDFRLSVSLGRLDPKPSGWSLERGEVIPLRAEGDGQAAIVRINGKPLLLGTVGETQGRYAVKITGPYQERRPPRVSTAASFQAIQWPSESA